MRPFDQIHDVETLREIARLQQRQLDLLAGQLNTIRKRVEAAAQHEAQLAFASEIGRLEEKIAKLEKQQFGDSSERRASGRPKDASSAPSTGHGPRQQELPIEERVHELPEDDRGCGACGGEVEPWPGQFEESDEITVEVRSFKIVRNKRQKYRCRCNGMVRTAPGPLKLIAGGRYSVDFAVDVAVAKYLDHLPLERQVRIMAREGLVVTSQALWDQLAALADHLRPVLEALGREIVAEDVVHADETWWRVMGSQSKKRWWAWALATPEAVIYRILPSRSKEAARALLDDYGGTVMSDGYGVYTALSRAGPGYRLAHCWAHVRRKYIEIEPFYPDEAAVVLGLIGQLYDIERELAEAPCDEVRAVRDTRSRRLVEEIRRWAMRQRSTPGSGLRKAIDYMLGLWSGLTVFLDDPAVPLDNNRVERALRGPVIGRKNHYGSRSRRGTEVAALFYSLLETATLVGVDPKRYLAEAARRAIAEPGAVLLPADLT